MRKKPSKIDLDNLQMVVNGHVLYTRKDFEDRMIVDEHELDLMNKVVYEEQKICKDCGLVENHLLKRICPNKGVGEVQVIKPVFMFHLTNEKTMAVVGDSLVLDRDGWFGVMEDGIIIHVFMREYVKYVVKQ